MAARWKLVRSHDSSSYAALSLDATHLFVLVEGNMLIDFRHHTVCNLNSFSQCLVVGIVLRCQLSDEKKQSG